MKRKQKIFLILSAILGVIIVITACLISVFKVDEKIEKLAMIHGTNIGSSLGDQATGGNSEAYINNQLLEVALMQNGFGYFLADKDFIGPPKLYTTEQRTELFYKINGIEPMKMEGIDITKEPGEKPVIKSLTFLRADDVTGKKTYYVKAWYIYKGETVESETLKAGFFLGSTADEKEEEVRESIREQYETDMKEFDKWKELYDAYTLWSNNGKYFDAQTPDGTIDSYTNFWIRVAEETLGTSFSSEEGTFSDNTSKENFRTMLEKLSDTTGGQNLLDSYINEEEISEEVENIITEAKENAGGTGSGGPEGGSTGGTGSGGSEGGNTGGTGSGSSEGGSTGGTGSGSSEGGSTGGTGSGSSEGGNTGGNTTGGNTTGGNTTGGNTTGGNQNQEDKVAPAIKSASITSPKSGTYKAGQEIKIAVTFDKNVYGTEKKVVVNKNTAPKLYIRFGDNGENKLMTFDSAKEQTIMYKYIIETADNGLLQIGKNNNYVGTIYSGTGVKAELTKVIGLSGDIKIVAENKTSTGENEKPEDKIAPTVKSAIITSPKTGTYKAGQEIKITVTFDKNVYGTDKKAVISKSIAPNLYIRFGDSGENKLMTFDSAKGQTIIYKYIMEKGDNGVLKIGKEDNYVGTVYSETGVKAELKTINELSQNIEIVADNVAPRVEKIETISEAGEYKTGDEIKIKVTFNENVYGTKEGIILLKTTGPILNIRFGEGEVRKASIDSINNTENYLIYKYIITSEDRDLLKVDEATAFDGTKTIYDKAGNAVNLVTGKNLTGNEIKANSNLTYIELDKKEITLDLNGTKTAEITGIVRPEGTKTTWESQDTKVVTIANNTGGTTSNSCKITAVAIGETTITLKAADGKKATCKVTVKDTTHGNTKVQLNKENLELDLNGTKTEQLTATVTPTEAGEVTWSSADEKVATIDGKTGKVTAVAKGETQIIAKAKDGTTATCKITVINSNKEIIEPSKVELNITNSKVILGKTEELQLKPILEPSSSNQNIKITYESSNENVATVDDTGKVIIKGKGTVVITATTENGKVGYSEIEVVEVTKESELSNKKIGDINGDGNIDITDLLSILRHIAASSSTQIAEKHQDWLIKDDQFIIADINANGIIDITDSLKLQRHIAALKNETIQSKYPDWVIETNWNNE